MSQDRNLWSGVATATLKEIALRYPWWGAVKMALHTRGEEIEDSILYAAKLRQRMSPTAPTLKQIDAAEFQRSSTLSIIDDFLLEGEHRITIGEATTDEELSPMGGFDEDEEEFVSEELAEIYAKQHLFDLAIEIYQKLSLQDSQKSIYFAELIERLKEEQAKSEQ